jgi:uncharacterized BrkB/YihY/UPF0761 family membrane protein
LPFPGTNPSPKRNGVRRWSRRSLGFYHAFDHAGFHTFPDRQNKIAWKDVWVGAALTAVLFTLGKFLVGHYLGQSSTTSAFGAAASLVIILIWVYYSSQIVLFGAEFTRVYANRYGSHVEPSENAVFVTEEARARQGMVHKESEAHTSATASS